MTPAEARTVLGVSPDAEPAQVQAAYRQLVKLLHPDRFPGTSAERRTAEDHLKIINRAYEVLKRDGTATRARRAEANNSRSTSEGSASEQARRRAEQERQEQARRRAEQERQEQARRAAAQQASDARRAAGEASDASKEAEPARRRRIPWGIVILVSVILVTVWATIKGSDDVRQVGIARQACVDQILAQTYNPETVQVDAESSSARNVEDGYMFRGTATGRNRVQNEVTAWWTCVVRRADSDWKAESIEGLSTLGFDTGVEPTDP